MKKQIITAMAVVAIVGVSSADVLFDSAFDGNTGAVAIGSADNSSGSTTLAINDWTTDTSVTAISGLTSISPIASGSFATIAGSLFATPDNVYINHNLNLADRASPRGYSLTFTTDTSWDLSNLSVLAGHSNNTASQNQAFLSDLTMVLSGGTLGADVTQTKLQVDYTGIAYVDSVFDLTGTTIGAGTYTLSVTENNMSGGGAYAVYDGITLEAIPEPATLGMVALFGGGILIIRRKFMI